MAVMALERVPADIRKHGESCTVPGAPRKNSTPVAVTSAPIRTISAGSAFPSLRSAVSARWRGCGWSSLPVLLCVVPPAARLPPHSPNRPASSRRTQTLVPRRSLNAAEARARRWRGPDVGPIRDQGHQGGRDHPRHGQGPHRPLRRGSDPRVPGVSGQRPPQQCFRGRDGTARGVEGVKLLSACHDCPGGASTARQRERVLSRLRAAWTTWTSPRC